MAAGGTDTSREPVGRGGAVVRRVRYSLVDSPGKEDNRLGWRDIGSIPALSEAQMWSNITYFLRAVIPVAEEAGVRMALHPDDPPISPVLGTACIIRSHAALRRVVEEIAPSDQNGLEFCQGTVSEMPDDVYEAIRYFGERKKISYVHFRNVSGKVPDFDETFIDDGYVDMWKAMTLYRAVRFDGVFIEDHVPAITGDTPHGHRSRAFAMGYAGGLVRMALAEVSARTGAARGRG
jgi:mannonate dehydratase